MDTQSIPNNPLARNAGQPAPMAQPQPNQICVELTRDCRTDTTQIVLPAGTRGRVVNSVYLLDEEGWYKVIWQIDFGLMTVVNLAYDSPLIRLVRWAQ
jgi:hypothetical protein